MSNPMLPLTALEILKIAFSECIHAGVGVAATKLAESASEQIQQLRELITSWFSRKKHDNANRAITAIETEGSMEALNKLATYLDDEMQEDSNLAERLQEILQNLVENGTQRESYKQYLNYGRDQINIGRIDGDQTKIGGS